MTPSEKTELVKRLGDQVDLDCPLASRVAFRIGGPADALVKPRTPEALRDVLTFAKETGLPVTVLGTGSNVLVSDRGIRGIALRLAGELADVHAAADGVIQVGAGALNAPLVALALSLDL